MLDPSPAHLLVLFIVVVVLLGPKRLPEVARQLGGAWRRLQEFRDRVEHEVRSTVPDLPSSQQLVRYARSPTAILDQLASMPAGDGDTLVVDPAAPLPGGGAVNGAFDGALTNGATPDGATPDGALTIGATPDGATGQVPGGPSWPPPRPGHPSTPSLQPVDDPSMN